MICGKIVHEVYPTHSLHAPCGLDKGHEGACSVKAFGERLATRIAPGMALAENLAQLRETNHRLSRDLDRCRKRKAIDSGAKVWLPYWRVCQRWVWNLKAEVARLESLLTGKDTVRCPDCLGDIVVGGTVTKAYYHLTPVCPASTKKV